MSGKAIRSVVQLSLERAARAQRSVEALVRQIAETQRAILATKAKLEHPSYRIHEARQPPDGERQSEVAAEVEEAVRDGRIGNLGRQR